MMRTGTAWFKPCAKCGKPFKVRDSKEVFTGIVTRNGKKGSRKTLCKKCLRKAIIRRTSNRRYEQSIKGKLSRKKYRNSEVGKYKLTRWGKTAKGKSWHKNYMKKYMQTDNGKLSFKLLNLRRWEAEHNTITAWTKEEWVAKVKACKGICWVCGKRFNKKYGHGLSMDHTYPVSLANKDYKLTGIKRIYSINDITPMGLSCNISKGDSV